MKARDSGMPEEDLWRTFFDVDAIFNALGLDERVGDAVDFGCGYGTFVLPAAQRISGTLHGFDIEPELIAECERRAADAGLGNLALHQRDFIADGTGMPADSVDFVMLFNILHTEDPVSLLREGFRILKPGGRVGVIHWNYDPATPRGPEMSIRPRPEDCARWMTEAGFTLEGGKIALPPHHYGWVGRRL